MDMSSRWFVVSLVVLGVGLSLCGDADLNLPGSDDDDTGPIDNLGYIVYLDVKCPRTIDKIGRIIVRADVNAHVIAMCSNGKRNFTRVDKATQILKINLLAGDMMTDFCRFEKRAGLETYVVEVRGGWGEKGAEVMTHKLRRLVSCTYDSHTGGGRLQPVQVEESLIAPKGLPSFTKDQSNIHVLLEAVNLYNLPIDGKSSNLGRLIRLRAKADQGKYVKPIQCVAINSVGRHYQIIRAGCGDGLVFEKELGFKYGSSQEYSYSEYFHVFKLPGADDIYFHCDFAICQGTCIESSCENERKKREAKLPKIIRKIAIQSSSGFIIVRPSRVAWKATEERSHMVGFPYLYNLDSKSGKDSKMNYIAALSALAAMLLVTMVALVVVCYRQMSLTRGSNKPRLGDKTCELNMASA